MADQAPRRVPAREIPIPATLSPQAQAHLASYPTEPVEVAPFPAMEDKAGWRARVAQTDQAMLPMLQSVRAEGQVSVERREIGGVPFFDVTPANAAPDDRTIVLDMHGGGLFLCAGDLCGLMAEGIALSLGRRIWSVDYRMPPDHPYPAALDDGMTIYRALLKERAPGEIIFSGASAGGNLAAALLLRARDEGLPLPAAAYLATPEIDLTESGDSFRTNLGVDATLTSLMPVNLLYAAGQDLRHPYLSPLFGDFTKGFPPTVLTTGTRDLFLSNTVLMHRALRDAGVPAELHVCEAGGHGNFPNAPEGQSIARDVRRFIAAALAGRIDNPRGE
ncbi:MAG TPA: alpha/beta hydrolase [Sphingobium sp.]|nr:alpha/beta hydrolase [Sphingobium sp.]